MYHHLRRALVALFCATGAQALPAPQAASSAPTSIQETPAPAPPTAEHQNVTSHGPFSGTPTTTGALSNSVLAPSIAPLPPNPTATLYPSDGQLHDPQPAPYVPAGGLGTNGTEPVYNVKSDFDYESIALALYQEWIELDLFYNGLATFSVEDFNAAGLTAEDRALIAFMAEQEVGHATLLTNILGAEAPKQCTYNYPFTTVREFIDFCQKLTRFGESGVYGFLNHLDSREAGQLLLQSISTEARQQTIFRQFDGLFPFPVWFEAGIPQSWGWTLLAPYISSCPENQTRLAWQNFPGLAVLNQPNPARSGDNVSDVVGQTIGNSSAAALNSTVEDACVDSNVTGVDCSPAVTHNRSEPLSFPGRQVFFSWEDPGRPVGPNNSYVTTTTAPGPAKYVAWVTQLNLTYSDLTVTDSNHGYTYQPDVSVYEGDPAINGTMFVALTSDNPFLTPFNLSMINPVVVAGPALYQAG